MNRTIVEESSQGLVVMDVFSKLIQSRIIFIDTMICDDLANEVIAQLLHLAKLSQEPIQIYINSPGGSVSAGLAIYDIIELLKKESKIPMHTYCIGQACSMGGVLLLAGDKRIGLKHSRVMLHQVQNGVSGDLKTNQISLKEAEKYQNELYEIIREKTLLEDLTSNLLFDKWFNAEESLQWNILTEIRG